MEPKVRLENISKTYQLYGKQSDKILDMFIPNKRKSNRTFNALSDVSFEILSGETIGIVGINGSGKSTLSNILAEVIPPTEGTITINGETSLIAINAGLNRQLSGLENIELKCLMLGLSKEDIETIKPDIIEFADIGQFIDQPVKNYSSGMKSRLGFAISAHTNPDILIVDEALSVGDKTFYQKCIDKINEFKKNGKTIIFISHSISQIRTISDRVLWMHHGKVREYGDTNEVLDKYEEFIKWFNKLNKQEKQKYNEEKLKEQQALTYSKKTRNRQDPNQGKRNIGFFLQITAILLITFLSAFFIFINKSPMAYYKEIKPENVSVNSVQDKPKAEKPNDVTPKVLDINKVGLIKVKEATLFSDEEMKAQKELLGFTDEVFVVEQIDDIYKVQIEDQVGYINEAHVSVAEVNSATVDMQLNELVPLLPDTVSSSYEFFYAFFGADYEDVKNGLSGLSEEGEEEGLQFLNYEPHNVKYIFNQENRADTIVFSNVKHDNLMISTLIEHAKLISNDGKLLYVSLNEDYEVILDLEVNELSLFYLNESIEVPIEEFEDVGEATQIIENQQETPPTSIESPSQPIRPTQPSEPVTSPSDSGGANPTQPADPPPVQPSEPKDPPKDPAPPTQPAPTPPPTEPVEPEEPVTPVTPSPPPTEPGEPEET